MATEIVENAGEKSGDELQDSKIHCFNLVKQGDGLFVHLRKNISLFGALTARQGPRC
jgi:hypothetical protein